MHRHLLFFWLVLLVLTAVGYVTRVTAEVAQRATLAIPLVAAAIKFAIVAWIFMELRTVSRVWAVGIGMLLFTILGIAVVLQMRVAAIS